MKNRIVISDKDLDEDSRELIHALITKHLRGLNVERESRAFAIEVDIGDSQKRPLSRTHWAMTNR